MRVAKVNRAYKRKAHESCNDARVLYSMQDTKCHFASAEGIANALPPAVLCGTG